MDIHLERRQVVRGNLRELNGSREKVIECEGSWEGRAGLGFNLVKEDADPANGSC